VRNDAMTSTATPRDKGSEPPPGAYGPGTRGPRARWPGTQGRGAHARPSPRPGAVPAVVLSVGIYVVLAVVCYWHLWAGGLTDVAQAGGDQVLFRWFLAWLPYALGHGLDPFFSSLANIPHGVNVLDNSSVLLLGLVASPITVLFGPTASFNVLETLALAASATSMYFVAGRFVHWRPAAFAAGLLYGFSPYEIGEGLGHLHLTFCVFPPVILLLVHDIVVRTDGSPRRRGIVLGLLVIGQFFVSTEVLATTVLIAAVIVVVIAVRGRHRLRSRLPDATRGLAWALGVAAVVLAYPIWFAAAGPGHIDGPLQSVAVFRADLLGPVVPDVLVRISPVGRTMADAFAGGPTENGSYLGITLLLVMAAGAVALRRMAVVQVAVVGGVVAFVLSLGARLVVHTAPGPTATGAPNGWPFPLPGALLAHLPLLDGVLPSRFSMYVDLAAAILLAVVVDQVRAAALARRGPVPALLAPVALGLVALVPLIPAVPYSGVAPNAVPRYFTSPAVRALPPGGAAVLYPYATSTVAQAQLWQTTADFRFTMPGGYFLVPQGPHHFEATSLLTPSTVTTVVGTVLAKLYLGTPLPRSAPLRRSFDAELAAWRVRSVLAFPAPGTERAVGAYLSWLLGRPPVVRDGADTWYHISSVGGR